MLEARIRYKDVLTANPGLATNVLADRLKRLERRGLLSKKRDPSDARQYVYMPTEAAIALIPMMIEMIVWSAGQGAGEASPSFVKRFETDRDALIAELKHQVRNRIQLP
jgi:DNA-binding HxlR family transcriptional regulator